MTVQLPVIIEDGLLQRLPSGDTITGGVELASVTNGNASSIVIGTPVYVSAADTVDKAQADSTSTSDVLGLVYDTSITASATGNVLCDGILEATTGQWDAVTGGAGGLTAGSKYYLDPSTAGMLTTTAPTTAGQVVAVVGVAISTTQLKINIEKTVLL